MTGSAPPPGETSPAGGNPWSSVDPEASWWRGDTAAHPTITPSAAGPDPTAPPAAPDPAAADAAAPDPAAADAAAPDPAAADAAAADVGAAEPAVQEPSEHVQPAELAEATGPKAAPDATPPQAATEPTPPGSDPNLYDEPTDDVLAGAAPTGEPDGQDDRPLAPQIMVLPEPAGERGAAAGAGTRGAVPGRQRPASSRPAAGRVLQNPPSAAAGPSKLETSPFWWDSGVGPSSGSARALDALPPPQPSRLGVPPRRVAPTPRRPAFGLVGLLALALAAAFFAWVSAEPLWLATGHGERGTVTITGCTGDGLAQRCKGQFTADGATFTSRSLTLLGVRADNRADGAVVPARMANRESPRAFVASHAFALHLRWGTGVLLVLLCGLGIAAATGARRLATPRARRRAVLASLAGPLALLAGFLAIAY